MRDPIARRWILPGVSTLVLLTASLAAFFLTRAFEDERLTLQFERLSVAVAGDVRRSFDLHLEEVYALQSLFASSEHVSRMDFRTFVRRPLERIHGIQALEWIPRVPVGMRSDYEERARADGWQGFRFRRWADDGGWYDSDAEWAEEYFPVFYMEPATSNEAARGIDLAAHPARRAALVSARDSGEPVATSGIRLAQEEGKETGFLMFLPVYEGGSTPRGQTERREKLEGFVLGVFRVGDIIRESLATRDLGAIHLRVVDETQGADLLFGPAAPSTGWQHAAHYEVGGRRWKLEFSVDRHDAESMRSWNSWVVLGTALGLTSLISTLMWVLSSRTVTIARTVQLRTSELEEAYEQLREVVDDLGHTRDRLERSNLELEQFAYVGAHELQEPLRKVCAFCELLAAEHLDSLDESARQYVDFAVEGARQMQRRIEDLLDYLRFGRDDSGSTYCDLGEVLQTALALHQDALDASDIEVTCDELPMVGASPFDLAKLLGELLDNAIKYRGSEPPRIRLSVEEDDDSWRFTMSSNGIKIEPQYHERVFGIFKRLHRHGDYPGTGIGLAICRRIVERYGGHIWAQSSEDAGTDFCFTIPKTQQSIRPLETKERGHGTRTPDSG